MRSGRRNAACYPVRTMSDYKEIIHERLYVKVPGGDRLRKNAAARQKHLLANGWRETERTQNADYIQVRFERTGHAPMKARLPEEGPGDPRPAPASSRRPRRPGRRVANRASFSAVP